MNTYLPPVLERIQLTTADVLTLSATKHKEEGFAGQVWSVEDKDIFE